MVRLLKRAYAKLDAVCQARPKTMAYGMAAFATACFFLKPGVWKHPEFAAWIAVAVLGPLPFQMWGRFRRSRRASSPK